MSKALIVYGTRYGAAASISEEIAKILGQEGHGG
jgi:flavodoxin